MRLHGLTNTSLNYCRIHRSIMVSVVDDSVCEYVELLNKSYHHPSPCRPVRAMIVWNESQFDELDNLKEGDEQ